MKTLKPSLAALLVVLAGALTGCSSTVTRAADVTDSLRASLRQEGLSGVSVSQDRNKGIVTLRGQVDTESEKSHAESVAKIAAGSQVVSNQIAVIPPGAESEAKRVNSDLDKGIESNLDAVLVKANLHEVVKFTVKNHVVTLSGNVDSQAKRETAQEVALVTPNVQQVVNELQVIGQKATSSK